MNDDDRAGPRPGFAALLAGIFPFFAASCLAFSAGADDDPVTPVGIVRHVPLHEMSGIVRSSSPPTMPWL